MRRSSKHPVKSSTMPVVASDDDKFTPPPSNDISAVETPLSAISIPSDDNLSKAEISLQKRTDALDAAVGQQQGSARKKLYANIARGLDAKKKIKELVDGKYEDREEPDDNAIFKYTELGLKVIGDLVEVKTEVNVDASRKELHISTSEKQELDAIRRKIYASIETPLDAGGAA